MANEIDKNMLKEPTLKKKSLTSKMGKMEEKNANL